MLLNKLVALFGLLAVFCDGGLTAVAQSPAAYSLSGTVIDGAHQAVPSVLVMLQPANQTTLLSPDAAGSRQLVVLSDPQGRFSFDQLPPGKYRLGAGLPGKHVHSLREHEQFSTAVVVGPGVDSTHVAFPLVKEARLAGTLIDADGDPVAQASVYLLRQAVLGGKRSTFYSGQQTTSTARGLFHFAHLLPGTYYIAVAAQPWYANTQSGFEAAPGDGSPLVVPPPALVDTTFAVTYSGSVTNPETAEPIVLAEGAAAETQITLHPVPSLHLTIPNQQPESAAAGVPPVFAAIGPGGVQIPVPTITTMLPLSATESNTEISGLAPGSYRVQMAGPRSELSTASTNYASTLTLSTSGVLPLPSRIASALHGHITFQNPSASGDLLLIAGNQTTQFARISPDGTFAFETALAPGDYQLFLPNSPGLAIQSVKLAAATPLQQGNRVTVPASAAALDLQLVAAPPSGSLVNGVALENGKPLSAAMVLMVPSPDAGLDIIGRDQSDSDGSFSMANIPAGRYTLLAISGDDDAVSQLEYRNRSVLTPYLSHGRSVEIPAHSPLQVEATPFLDRK